MPSAAKFLVIEGNPLIAEDLAEIVRSRDAAASVTVRASLGEARAVLENDTRIDTAFITIGSNWTQSPEMRQLIQARVNKVILISDDDRDLSVKTDDWVVLSPPFTSASVSRVLDRMDKDGAGRETPRQ